MESVQVEREKESIRVNSSLQEWCEAVFERLARKHEVVNSALFIYVDEELKLAASRTQNVFHFYAGFKPVEEYSGYALDLPRLVEDHQHHFSFITNASFNAGWSEDNITWEHTIIPLYKKEDKLGYLLLEAERYVECPQFRPDQFNWLLKDADNYLRCKILSHRLSQQKASNRQSELDLALNNRTLASQLSYMKSLHEISLRFTKATSIHSLCRIAIELGREKLQIDRMGIFLCDMDTATMWGTWGTDPHGNVVDRSDFQQEMPNTLFMEEAFTKQNELIVKENVPLYFGKKQVGIGWNIMMAMWDGDECIGWIAADNLLYRTQLDQPKKEAIKLLAASVCQKIVKLRETEAALARSERLQARCGELEDKLNKLSRQSAITQRQERWMGTVDNKTGLPNTAYFTSCLDGFLNQAKKEKKKVAAFAVNIDSFRAYRKTYGEMATCTLVKKLARQFDDLLEKEPLSMLVYNQHGQYSLLVGHDDDIYIRELAEGMVQAVHKLNILHDTSKYYDRVTISIGVTLNTATLFTRKRNLMKKAEKLKTTAVELGQNRVCID